ncbi:MAG TPA: fibronectin type III domain-containing protein, partial [Thermoanaerobaculia bacterium]
MWRVASAYYRGMGHKSFIVALCLSIVAAAHAAIPDAQRQALVDFYNATHGANWTKNTGWNGAAGTECTWFGVTCDSDSTTVTALSLPSNAMVGAIPHSILNLTDLSSLSIEFNGLYSTDPQVVAFINAHQPNILNFQTVAPTGLVVLPDNRSTLTLSWTQVPYREQDTHFDIYSGTTLLKSVPYTSNVATFTGLDSTKSYSFQIRTVTGGLTSDPSAIVAGTPGPPPGKFEIASSTLKTFWVDPVNGNDSNNGTTEATPFKTIDTAYQAGSLYSGQRGGYEIVLRPGDYPQSAFLGQFIAVGSQDLPAVMRAEVPGTAILHGLLGAQGSHIYLIGLTLVDALP